MTRDSFIDKTIQMIQLCEYNEGMEGIASFKLRIEKNNVRSTTITAQVLLIFEQLFGVNFMFNSKIRSTFNWNNIINYLTKRKEYNLNLNETEYSRINVNRLAYCGIALLLLKKEKEANEIADLFCNNKINNEYAWGICLSTNVPDILSTYLVTMLLNRLHRDFSKPSFINELMQYCDFAGIPYNKNTKDNKYIEALTLALYMDKYYYMLPIDDEKIKVINTYYYNGIEPICLAKESYFKEHPNNQWRIYGFGLASNLVCDMSNPFYEYILEELTTDFDMPQTNISYVLEICRMYNAVNRNHDPFIEDRIFTEFHKLKKSVDDLEKRIYDLNEYNREITIKIPIATAFVGVYFLLFGLFVYIFTKTFFANIIKINDFNEVYVALDLGLSVIVPSIFFVFKKTRIFIINLVDKFYKKFNVVRTTNNKNSENNNAQ